MALPDRTPWVFAGRSWERTAAGVAIAVVGTVLATVFVTATGFRFESLPYVLVILASTIVGRRIAGAVAVVMSVVLLDYYVVEPLHKLNPGSRTEFWSLVAFAAVVIVVAELVGWMEGVGDRERHERDRMTLLVHAGDAVSSAVGAERALTELARVFVPSFADWAVVHAARPDGSLQRVAAIHAAGGDVERALLEAPDADPSAAKGVGAVVRTGRSELYESPGVEEIGAMTQGDAHLDTVLRAGLGSSIVAPLTARERTFGAVTVVRGRRRRPFTRADVALVEEIAARSALVVDGLRLVELERRSAGLSTVLQELTAALSACVTSADVGLTVVQQSPLAMDAVAAAFAVRLPDGTVELREQVGHDPAPFAAHGVFSIDASVPLAQAMRTGRTVVIRSIEERDRRYPALAGVPPSTDHALVCLPFVVRGSAIGGLAVTFGGPRSFEAWELSFMESIASQAAQALDRAMLFESERYAKVALETSTDRLERLLMVAYRLSRVHERPDAVSAIVDSGVRAAGAEGGLLVIVDAGTDELVLEGWAGFDEDDVAPYRRAPLSSRFAHAEAARSGHPIWAAPADERPMMYPGRGPGDDGEAGSTAVLPLVVAGRTLGVLTLGFAGERAFDEEERDFLLTLAGLCAQSLQGSLVLQERESARAEAEFARERIELLAEATRLLSSSLDVETTIAELADLCVPRIADWMSVAVRDGRDVREIVVRHPDTIDADRARDLRRWFPLEADGDRGIARVLRTGVSELVARVDDEVLKSVASDAESFEALRSLGLTSVATVPLAAGDRVLGVLTVANAGSGRRFEPVDLTFFESLGRRAAVAIDNARLFRDREHMARALQRSLLPRRLPRIPGVELAVRYIPYGAGHDVGGDFYDAFAGLDDSWGVLIGDVCGKGAEAASIVGIVRHTVRGLAMAYSRPSSILEALNRAILEESPWDRFATACYVRLRPDVGGFRATIALGGHLPPLLVSPGGEVREVGEPGSLLGILEHPAVTDVAVDVSPGDVLVLYTDGLEEPRSTPDVPADSVESILRRSSGMDAERIADELLAKFRAPQGRPPRDDVALVVLRFTGLD
jgi:GAF domain-containing protein